MEPTKPLTADVREIARKSLPELEARYRARMKLAIEAACDLNEAEAALAAEPEAPYAKDVRSGGELVALEEVERQAAHGDAESKARIERERAKLKAEKAAQKKPTTAGGGE